MLPTYKPSTVANPLKPRESFLSSDRQRVIKREFVSDLFFPPAGRTIFRALPLHADSVLSHWMYEFRVYDLAPRSAGFVPEIPIPHTLVGAPPIVDRIRIFARFIDDNYPHLAQLRGAFGERPLAIFGRDRAMFWMHVHRTPANTADDRPVRLWYGSAYRGNAKLRPGPLHCLQNLCYDAVPTFDGSPGRPRYGDISHPVTGRLASITVERNGEPADHSGGFAIDEAYAPLDRFAPIYAAHPDFGRLNVPLEDAIRVPTAAELTEVLENYLGWQVRHGHATEEVYEAYEECFGEPVAAHRRATRAFTLAVGQTSAPVVLPSVTLPKDPARPCPASAEPAHRPATRIQDDLDDSSPAVPAPAQRRDPPCAAPTDASPATARPACLNVLPRTSSKEELLNALRSARKLNLEAEDNTLLNAIRTQLVWRFHRELTTDDFTLIDSFAPPC